MISYTSGNILFATARAIVIPVNCKGVMGKGLASQYKYVFPDGFKTYLKYCNEGKMKIGKVRIHNSKPRSLFFPTKDHWKDDSKLEYIEEGLKYMANDVNLRGLQSIAVPMLGCGLGNLDWRDVHPLIVEHIGNQPWNLIIYGEPPE